MGFKYVTRLPAFLSSTREWGYTHKEGPLLQLDGWDGKSLPGLFKVRQQGCAVQVHMWEEVPGEPHQAAMLKETWKSQSLMNPARICGGTHELQPPQLPVRIHIMTHRLRSTQK